MKLSDILNEEEFASPTDGIDSMNADNLDKNKEVGTEARDIAHKEKSKIMKIGRGDNHKKAKSIAGMAKAKAREADAESSDTPHQSPMGGYSPNNFRLVT
jgi:hypothetical protein